MCVCHLVPGGDGRTVPTPGGRLETHARIAVVVVVARTYPPGRPVSSRQSATVVDLRPFDSVRVSAAPVVQ